MESTYSMWTPNVELMWSPCEAQVELMWSLYASSGGVHVESTVEYLESKWSVCGVCGVQVESMWKCGGV